MMRAACFFLLSLPLIGQAAPAAHPRLYLTPQRIVALRQEITTFRQAHWDVVRNQADGLAKRHPPAYKATDAEQLWERDVGNALPTLAMAWVLTGAAKYRAAAEEWAMASCGYPTWGLGEKYEDSDLAAAHLLFGLSMVYDWMYADLDPRVRDAIHGALLSHGRNLYRATDPKTGRSWRDEFLQNHLWVSMTGLAAAALAIPEEPETAQWLAVARDKFQRSDRALGPDGASQEGAGYWSYGVEYLLKFWALSADLLGEDLQSGWWSKTALYRLYLGIPRAAWTPKSTIIDIADCTRQDYYGPDYLLFNLAHRFHDPHAQWLALEMEKSTVTTDVAPFLNLLWFDPKQPAKDPSDLPLMHHFESMGIVSTRTDWGGKESMVVFKCGPPAGHDEVKKAFPQNPGFGHVHPDANHFVVFGNGQFLIQDDGYRWKETGQHNTLLVDGVGQMGEHNMWFGRKPPLPLKGEPTILTAESNAEFDLMAGDATGAYGPQAGLRKFVRRVIFWKPSIVLVIDDIETDRPRNLELRFHPLENGNIRIDDLTPAGVITEKGMITGKDRDGSPFPQYTVRMQTTAAKWRHVTAISWAESSAAPGEVKVAADGDGLTFQSGAHSLTFSWRSGNAASSPASGKELPYAAALRYRP